MAISFLQAGDLHLDAPFSSLAPKMAIEARKAQRTLLSRISTLAKREEVDLVLLTGDLFDSKRIYPETLSALQEMFAHISCPIFISPGNHDPYTNQSIYQNVRFPQHVHIFSSETVTAVHLPNIACTIYGSAFMTDRKTTPALEGFVRQHHDGLHIGCFHANLTSSHSPYSPISKHDIAKSHLHYIALGHIHEKSNIGKVSNTKYAYSGAVQGRGFDEMGDKGVFIGHLDEDDLTLSFYPICTHRYLSIEIDVTNQTPDKALLSSLPQTQTKDIARLIFKGVRHDSLPISYLETLAKPLFQSVSIDDQTTLAIDYESLKHKHSLMGLFLQEMEMRMANATDQEQKTVQLALQFGISALEQREDPL